jgi:LysM repeat protein
MNVSRVNGRRSGSTIVAGLASLAALIGFTVGVPFALLRLRPHPLPERWPEWSRVVTMMKAGTVDSAVLPNVVAILVWACWAGMTLCVLAEIFGRSRGRSFHIPVISTGFGGLSRRWVGTIAAMIAMLLPQGVVSASPLSGKLAATSSRARTVVSQTLSTQTTSAQTTRAQTASAQSIAFPSSRRPAQSQDSSADSASVLAPSRLSAPPTSSQDSPSDPTSSLATVSGRIVIVQPGDSYWELADTLTGDGFKWRELLAANVGRSMPDGYVITEGDQMLHSGWELNVPTGWGKSGADEWHQRIVKRGDTLSKIAAAEYGSAKAWPTIAADNPQVASHPNLIIPGDVLSIRGGDGIADANHPDGADQAPSAPHVLEAVDEPALTSSLQSASPGQFAAVPTNDPFAFPEASQALPDFQHANTPNSTGISPIDTEPTVSASGNDLPSATVADTNTKNDSAPAGLLVGFIGVTSALAAAVLWRLKRQRQEQQVVRLVSSPPTKLTTLARKAELSYRAVADESQLGWIDAALLLAQHRVKGTRASVHMISAHQGWVEFRLDHHVAALAPFEPLDDASWKLSLAVARHELVDPAMDVTNSTPFMLSVGDTTEGPVWVSLDDVETVNVVSDNPEITDAVLASWAVQLLAVPWSQERSVVLIGAPDSVQQLAEGTHAECVMSSSVIDPRSWMTERVTVLSFVGYDAELAALVSSQASRIVVLTADDKIDTSRVDTITLHADATTLGGVLEPGNVALTAVSLAGPSQLGGICDLIGITEIVHHADTDLPAQPAWDATVSPVASSVATNWASEAHTLELVALNEPEPSVTMPIPTFDFKPAPSSTDAHALEPVDDFIARVMTRKPVELTLFADRPTAEIDGTTASRSVADLLLFLAIHGPVAHEDLIASVYPTRHIERSAMRQLVWRARQFVGNVLVGGEKTIGLDEDGYGLDWHRFAALTTAGEARRHDTDREYAVRCYELALRLVGALPWDGSGPMQNGEGEWATSIGLVESVIASVTNTATTLAQLALEVGRPELATWAAHQVLGAHPFPNVELIELGFEGALRSADHDGAHHMRASLIQARDEYGVAMSPQALSMLAALDEPVKVGR